VAVWLCVLGFLLQARVPDHLTLQFDALVPCCVTDKTFRQAGPLVPYNLLAARSVRVLRSTF
jgi:hypothetical protein